MEKSREILATAIIDFFCIFISFRFEEFPFALREALYC